MSSTYTSLSDLGTVAISHRGEVDEVKRCLDIKHGYFDAWIYGFLENKKFNVNETVEKLHRRFAMEVNELASYELTDYMRESLRKGIIMELGNDKAGRVAFFVNTKRDQPQAKYREEQRRSFDMFVSYGMRLRKENKRCQMVMLINQEGASLFKNVDMTFQADIALRISKYYPGGVDKMYICKMSRTLAAMAKPIFKRLPSIVADRIQIIDETDIKQGVLLDLFDEEVLPVALGGKNMSDNEEGWCAYADRVEKHFADMKRAIIERGLTVKEYELECIGIDARSLQERSDGRGTATATSHTEKLAQSVRSFPAQPPSPEPSHHSTPRDTMWPKARGASQVVSQHFVDASPTLDPDLKSLNTCFTEMSSLQSPGNRSGVYEETAEGPTISWAGVVAPLPESLALFFLDELLRWRVAVESSESSERYKILDAFVSGLKTTTELGVRGLDVSDRKWYVGIPYPLRALYRTFLLAITVLNVIYFLAALVFCTVFCANIIITTFFGFFVNPSQVFPLSAVLLMVAIQGASLCTRAADCILAVYNRNVIPPFERLGSYWGAIAEVVLFFFLLITQFIIFCVYAARDNPLRGLQVSFVTGWLSALFVVVFMHVFFFTGLLASPATRGTDNRLAALPFFLAFNFGNSSKEQQREIDARFMLRTSSYVICGIPLLISMLFGVAFLISRIVSLYVATFVISLIAAYVVHYYSEALSNTLSGSLLRFTLWMMVLAWCYVTFVFGFRDYSNSYGASVIVVVTINAAMVLMALTCLRRPSQSRLLRVSYLVVIGYVLGCWLSLFPLVSWHIGLFCLALMVHNALSIIFAPGTLTGIHASFFLVVAVMLLGISCVLLGWYGTTLITTTAQSLPSVSPAPTTLSNLELYHRYPVCTLQMGNDNSLRVLDIALMNEIVGARTVDVFNADFNNWFGTRSVTYNGIAREFRQGGASWEMHEFVLPATADTTVFVLRNRYATSSIMSMVNWVDAIALSPLSIFMPYDWVDTVVFTMSFVSRLIPFPERTIVNDIKDFLLLRKSQSQTNIIVTGSGVPGGVLSAAAAQTMTHAIVFSSPGLLHCAHKLGVLYDDYHRYVLSIGAYYGVLNYVGGQDSTISQRVQCRGSTLYCIRPQFFSGALLEACGDADGRRHIPSK